MAFLSFSPLKHLPISPLCFPATPEPPFKTNLQVQPCFRKPLSVSALGPDPMRGPWMEQKLSFMIEEKVNEAQKICEENAVSEECVVAWDEVEEVSQAKAHLKQQKLVKDPLEAYCVDHPEAPECRIHGD